MIGLGSDKKRRTTKYGDEATTDDEEGIEEEGLELPVKDVKGEEKMGGGKRGLKMRTRKAKKMM